MKIAVLGTGMVGRTVSVKLSGLGHHVTMGTRNVADLMHNTKEGGMGNPPFSNWYKKHRNIHVESFQKAAEAGEEFIINCTAGLHSLKVLQSAGSENLNNKIIIDIANPLDFSKGMPPTLNPVNDDSLGEQLQAAFPNSHIVKALNTMNANVMVSPSIIEGDHNVFICGNNDEAKKKVLKLLITFGWKEQNIIDLGDITNSRGTEMLLPVWIRLWSALGTANFNFHIQK